MDKKVFELVIDDEDDSGVSMIAIVDAPAIERDFHKFKQSEPLDCAAVWGSLGDSWG